MSHDIEAAYASSELADIITKNPTNFFGTLSRTGSWNLRAGREGGHLWPLADGVLLAENTLPSVKDVNIAFEYKRPNEGVHGILTALGQSFAYLEKGYDASVMVIPVRYSSHSNPGEHIKQIIDDTAPDIPISIYTYDTPNLSASRPFHGKLRCVREIDFPSCRKITPTAGAAKVSGNVSTLWAHMREGMSHPDAFFRYCQAVKIVSSMGEDLSKINIPTELKDAILRISPGADIYKYLSNTPGDTIADKAWRYLWFNYYFWNDLMPIYKTTTPYVVNDTKTRIKIDDTDYQQLFSGRSDSIKTKLVNGLNSTPPKYTLTEAWDMYARKVRNDAHSYKEVIDSGLYHIGFLDSDGSLTDLGYKYVEQCERTNNSLSGISFEILRSSVLQNGQYGALLHYIYKFSEEKFSSDLYAFTKKNSRGDYEFESDDYWFWIDDIFANTLHISKKSTMRAGGTRKPLQAEIAFLKKLGFVKSKGRSASYRIGVGLEIDWPQVQNSMLYFQTL